MTNEQRNVLLQVADAITEAVNALPNGIPAGHLYAMMMQYMSLDQFNQVMAALVKTNKIRKQGLLYLPKI